MKMSFRVYFPFSLAQKELNFYFIAQLYAFFDNKMTL